MAQYKVLVKSFINNSLHEADSIIEYDGVPHDNLEPIDKAAVKASEKSSKTQDAEDVARMKLAAAGGDPSTLDDAPAAEPLV